MIFEMLYKGGRNDLHFYRKSGGMELYEQAVQERLRIEKEIKGLKTEIKKLPNGRIECHRRGDDWSWHVKKKGQKKKEYLSKKKDVRRAEALAYKRNTQRKIEYLENHLKALKDFTENDSPDALKKLKDKREKTNPEINRLAGAYYDRVHPEIAEARERNLKQMNDNIQQFQGKEIDIKEYPVKSVWGLRFRSKTEALIYDRLRAHELLVLYEPDMELAGVVRSPDFIVYNKRTGQKFVWEHFGKMHDYGYHKKNKWKLLDYLDAGFIPNINMIATFEINDNSVDLVYIESLIENFLL